MRTIGKALVLAMAVSGIAAVSVGQTAQKPAFEVASIKRNTSGQQRVAVPVVFLPGRLTATNATLVDVIVQSYPTRRIQMQGGPDWIDSDRFDIVAKADDAGGKLSNLQMRQMARALLEDRFKLTLHVEKKEMPVYAVVLGKDPPKIQKSKDGDRANAERGDRGQLTFTGMSIVGLVNTMANILRTPVVDSTGLTGLYDFTLAPYQSSPGGGPRDAIDYGNAVLSAVQDQLGFKGERRKELLDITVIDHAERPTEN